MNLKFVAIVIIFCLIIILNYIDLNYINQQAFSTFKVFSLLLFTQIFGIVTFAIVQFINNANIKSLFYSPLSLLGLNLIISLSVFYAFDEFLLKELGLGQATGLWFRLISAIFILGIIYLLAKTSGAIVLRNNELIKPLQISTGLCGLIGVFFLLGSINLLNVYSILGVSLFVLGLGYKENLSGVKMFFRPIQDHQNINYWGFIIFYLLLIALTINFLAIQSPYPYGFDARNYYMNSTQLIAQSQGLIEGFQPYNWQLLMSLGFILFDSHEVAISISFFAFILCLIAINDFTKDVFKLDINYRLLIMLLITVSPAFYNQLSIDVKIDFALLFYQIVIVHLFVKLCQAKEWNWKLIIIFGLLNGFALGIKFTHLYLLASMIIVYWGIQGGVVALLSGAALGVGAFLIAKIDDVGGLRSAHLGVDYQQWIVLAIGAGLFIFLAISEREKWLKLMRFSLLFGAIAIIPMLPWMGKNYIETKSLSPKTLLMGKAPGYQMNLNSFIKNYEAQK